MKKNILFSLLLVFIFGFYFNVDAVGLRYVISTKNYEVGDCIENNTEVTEDETAYLGAAKINYYLLMYKDMPGGDDTCRIKVDEKIDPPTLDADQVETITISDTSVVKLDSNNNLVILKPGTVTITFGTIEKTITFSCPAITGGIPTYNIYFNSNGGSNVQSVTVQNQSNGNNTYPTLPTPKKTGYKFDGWYFDNTFKTKISDLKEDMGKMEFDPEYDEYTCPKQTSGTTLYAKWVEDKAEYVPVPNTGLSGSKLILIFGYIILVIGALIVYPIIQSKKNNSL